MKKLFTVFLMLSFLSMYFYGQDAVSIVRKVDRNEIYDSIKYEGEMIIELSGKKYVKTFYSYSKGTKNFFAEFINQDDAGTKYLKKDGNLYVYSPDTEEVIPITGHMLKESMMGSDMSYEDTISNDTLESRYTPTIVEETKMDGKDVWVLELIAKKKTESYPKQKMWVTKDTFNAIKVELFALSGAKLKEQTVTEVKKIGERYFPTIVIMKDLLRKNSQTTFKMNKIEIDVNIPENTFSLRNLEK